MFFLCDTLKTKKFENFFWKNFKVIIFEFNKGIYSLPPVPEAVEYETTDNSSSLSTLHEDTQNTETEYQIEHGRVCSSAVSNKKFFQVTKIKTNFFFNFVYLKIFYFKAPNSINETMSTMLKKQHQIHIGSHDTTTYMETHQMSIKYEGVNSEVLTDATVSLANKMFEF